MKKPTHDDRIKTMVKLLTIAEFVEDNNDAAWLQFTEDIKEIIKYFEKKRHPMIYLLSLRKGTQLKYYGSSVWLGEDTQIKYYSNFKISKVPRPIDRSKGTAASILMEGSLLQLNGIDVWLVEETIVHHYKDLSF